MGKDEEYRLKTCCFIGENVAFDLDSRRTSYRPTDVKLR